VGAVGVASGGATDWNPRWNSDRRWTPLAIAASGARVHVAAAVTVLGNPPACVQRP
jgi:hypothetical protein